MLSKKLSSKNLDSEELARCNKKNVLLVVTMQTRSLIIDLKSLLINCFVRRIRAIMSITIVKLIKTTLTIILIRRKDSLRQMQYQAIDTKL